MLLRFFNCQMLKIMKLLETTSLSLTQAVRKEIQLR